MRHWTKKHLNPSW